MKNLIGVLAILTCACRLESARILAIFPVPGKSHYSLGRGIAMELVKAGHVVDMVTHFPSNEKIDGFNELSVLGSMELFVGNIPIDQFETSVIAEAIFVMEHLGTEMCEKLFETEVFRKLRDERTKRSYDLLIVHGYATDCFLVLSHLYGNIPVIAVSTNINMPWHTDRFGDVDNPSYIPIHLSDVGANMNLWQRVKNTFHLNVIKLLYQSIVPAKDNGYIKKYAGPDAPDVTDLVRNISLLFVNSHYSFSKPRPLPPTVVEIAGIHIKPTEPLTDKALLELLEIKNKGVIVVSFGSIVAPETFEEVDKNALLDGLGRFKEYTVVWKGLREYFRKDIPENIVFVKWLPQQQLLCHPKTKLFITHGGGFGTQEGLHCAVPMLGFPLFADQYLNMINYIDLGVAEQILFDQLTEELLVEKLTQLLGTDKYHKRMKEVSRVYKDRPMSAAETVVYWTEYVIRNKGAGFLKPHSTKLWWYERNLLDVAGVFVGGVVLAIYALYRMLLVVKRFCNGCLRKDKTD